MSTHLNSRRVRLRLADAALLLLLVIALVTPIVGMVVTLRTVPEEMTELSPPRRPIIVAATAIEVDGSVTATAELTWAAGPAAPAPNWTGLVTAVGLRRGDVVRTGTVVGQVGGVDRVAMASASPFHRPLRRGDQGPDVVMLRRALLHLGYSAGPIERDKFDSGLERAVIRLEARLTGAAQRRPENATFQPDWFVWLPRRAIRAHQVALKVGSPAPPAGETAVTGPPTLAAVKVKVAETVQLEKARYEFVVGNSTVPLNETLSAAGAAVRRLRGLTPGVEAVEGTIRLVDRRTSVQVPVAAVMSGPDRGACVLVSYGDGFRPVAVTVGPSGGFGSAEVTSGIEAGTDVVANPKEAGLACD